MSRMSVVAVRTFGRLVGQSTTGFAAVAFLAASGALFASGIFAAEGNMVSVASVWAVAAANALPLLVSLVTMRLWSGDGDMERTELDLVAPVPERAFAAGRFLAAYWVVVAVLLLGLAVPLVVLPRCAPALAPGLTLARFLPAMAALCVFALPLTAIGSLSTALFRRAAPAAVASFAVTCALPYAAYRALVAWSPFVRARFAEPPVDSIMSAAADGYFSVGKIAVVVAVTFFAVFMASKVFALRRLAGGGRFALKISTAVAIASAALATVLFSVLAHQLDVLFVWPGTSGSPAFSARTREILSGISREVHVTVYANRSSAESIAAARLLKAISAESHSLAGAGVSYEFVDPRWDPNAALQVAKVCGGADTVVFSFGNRLSSSRRRIEVPLKLLNESVCASAIQRLAMPVKGETVLFTMGHGEPAMDDFGPAGMSDAVRALRQEGYRVGSIFTATSPIPADCSVLAVVGARTTFSAAETRDVEMFLSQGGHLLATLPPDGKSGLWGLLEKHGVAADFSGGKVRTTDGSDIVVSQFGEHAVTAPLQGSAVVFSPGSVRIRMETPSPDKGSEFSIVPLCESHGHTFAVAAEKGASLKDDLAIRPVRMVLIGDQSFLGNASVASRANANHYLFLNSVAWLAGLDVSGSAGMSANVLSSRMDRRRRIRLVLVSVCCVPAAAAALSLLAMFLKRRRRS